MNADSPRLRLGVVGIVCVSLFAALFARLWFLQVLSAPTFQVAAESNRLREIQEMPLRGRILDRNGKVLVDNEQRAVVTVDRAAITDPDERAELFGRLAPVLGLAAEDLEARWNDGRYNPLLPLPVAVDVPEQTMIYLNERSEQFPGVRTSVVAVRTYPYGPLAAHLLGYVGEISQEELKSLEAQGYEPGEPVGKTGAERFFEKDLRGTPGRTSLEVDSKGRVLRVVERVPPVPGADVRLTIDIDLQAAAEAQLEAKILERRVRMPRNAARFFPAPAGSVVVMDPQNGQVVAMASYPTFDPRLFVDGIRQSDFDALQHPDNHYPLNNRAIQGVYAPGSTFKLITAIAGMSSGLIDSAWSIYDGGKYTVPDCTGQQCTFGSPGDGVGTVEITGAMASSSDVFFYDIGARLWQQRDTRGLAIQDTARRFGLGSETGFTLPGELPGRVPDPDSKRAMHESNPEAFPNGDWYIGDNVNLSIGQGDMGLTPLQLTNVYATFSNGGQRLAPNIALRVERRDGTVVREFGKRVLDTVPLDEGIVLPLLVGLKGAVDTSAGTAYQAFKGFPLDAFPIAGKTGTAQVASNEDWLDTSLFVGFGPVAKPQFVITAVLEKAGFGSDAAAPLVRTLFEYVSGVTPVPPAEPVITPPAIPTIPAPEATTTTVPAGAVPDASDAGGRQD